MIKMWTVYQDEEYKYRVKAGNLIESYLLLCYVNKDIPSNVVAAGNPCRVIKQIDN